MRIHHRSVQVAGAVLLLCLLPVDGQKAPGNHVDPEMFRAKVVTKEVVKDNPYSAEGVSEVTQTQPDGSTRTRRFVTHQYRASDGRIRLEECIVSSKDIWADASNEPKRFSVFDPATRKGFVLDPQDMLVEHYYAGQELDVPANRAGFKTEQLAAQVLEGLTLEGTRHSKTISAGEMGNAHPVEIFDESWYSPDLHVVVMTRHSDPQVGNVVYKLRHIDRTEPPAGLFEVPAGYRDVGAKNKVRK